MTEKLDLNVVQVHVGTAIDWVLSVSSTTGEVCAILARALQVVLEAVPLEERTERMLVLARALDGALDEIEQVMAGDEDPWPLPPVKH